MFLEIRGSAMRVKQALIVLWLLPVAMLAPAAAAADGQQKLAVIPLQNLAQLDSSEADYLSDVMRGAVTQADPSGLTLTPQAKVVKAAGKKLDACDESCATKVARKVGADLVLLAEVRKLGEELRATVKLLSVDGELVGMQRALGGDAAGLEGPLEQAVLELLGAEKRPPSTAVAVPPPEVPAPVEIDEAYYANVYVTTIGTKEGSSEGEPKSVQADVYVNGRLVGTTPLEEGLPTGTYKIEVKSKGRLLHAQTLDVNAGGSYRVEAKAIIPLTESERAEREKQRREEYEARQAELAKEWDETRGEWEVEDAAAAAKRKPYLIAGTALMIGGLGLLGAGIGMEVRAKQEDDNVDKYYELWRTEVDSDLIKEYRDKFEEAKDSRNTFHALGITFLAVGGASVITSIVLYSLMPARPEEPSPPAGLMFGRLEVQPLIAPDLAGLTLAASF